jgi:hypothetical protein
MVETLRCGSINDVADLISSGYRAFYAKNRRPLTVSTNFWKPEWIKQSADCKIPEDEDVRRNFQIVCKRDQLSKIKPYAAQFAVTIHAYSDTLREEDLEITTHVFNSTMLEDIVKGQTFAASSSRYVISSTCESSEIKHFFDKWLEHRNSLIAEATARIIGPVLTVYRVPVLFIEKK